MTAAGVSTTGWQLYSANAVSADGSVFAGWGYNPSGKQEAFVARVPLAMKLSSTANMTVFGTQGGPFSPGSFGYDISSGIAGSFTYTIAGMPSWLTASSTSGTLGSVSTLNNVSADRPSLVATRKG